VVKCPDAGTLLETTMSVSGESRSPVVDARVRYLCHAIARRILAIPPDVSRHGRAVRIGKIRERLWRFRRHMTRSVHSPAPAPVVVTVQRDRTCWLDAECRAWQVIEAAIGAGEPLERFLFPNEAATAG